MTKIICDRCEKEITNEDVEMGAYINITHDHGYGSDRDGETDDIDLCEKCWCEVVSEINKKSKKK